MVQSTGMKKRLLAYTAPVIWMIFIFVLSSQQALPGPQAYWQDFLLKKLSHILVYGVLYILWFNAMNLSGKPKRYLLPFLFTIAFAISDEFHQVFVPGRAATMRDIGYDTVGMTVAILKLKRFI